MAWREGYPIPGITRLTGLTDGEIRQMCRGVPRREFGPKKQELYSDYRMMKQRVAKLLGEWRPDAT